MFKWLRLVYKARIKIAELNREIAILEWNNILLEDEKDYEERRRELWLALAIEELDFIKGKDKNV